ncbi:hypothetical protein ACSTS3_21540 [Aquimarina muelleri]|uniref:hypothetical protein n=1 Tax=Aquimarina muelleri TaxID=279356 RepID=UPI003F68932E
MKKLLLIFCSIYTLSSCGQKNDNKINSNKETETMIYIPERYKHINEQNFVDEIVKQVKNYDKEPMYFIRPLQNNCVYELLVNDYPIYKDYGIEKLATPIEINHAILKSGQQTVTVRLYPLGDALQRAYGEGETVTTLLPKTEMKVSVVKYEAFNISQDLDDEIVIKEHTAPTKEGTNEFIGAGLPYYEYTFAFNAEVPYSNKGWSNGEDLTKLDKEELEKKVLEYYKGMQKVFMDYDLTSFLESNFGDELKNSIALFDNKNDISKGFDWYKETIKINNKIFFPLENYEMQFFGNGRIVALKNPSKEPVHRKFRGRSAFGFKYKEDENSPTKGKWLDLYLYLPKGQPLNSLQMIE